MLHGAQALAVSLERFIRIPDLRAAVRRRIAVRVQIHEHHLFDRQNALACDLVAHFRAQRDRRRAEVGCLHAQFDDVALTRRADEVDLRHELGHDALVVELTDCVDGGFFIDPAQQAATEQRGLFQTSFFVKMSYDAAR